MLLSHSICCQKPSTGSSQWYLLITSAPRSVCKCGLICHCFVHKVHSVLSDGAKESAGKAQCTCLQERNLEAGEVLFEQGDDADAVYIVLSGKLVSKLDLLQLPKCALGDI
jgi:hypothetical protein